MKPTRVVQKQTIKLPKEIQSLSYSKKELLSLTFELTIYMKWSHKYQFLTYRDLSHNYLVNRFNFLTAMLLVFNTSA